MIKVSKSLPDISVLRGGKKDFKQSLSEGGEVLASLTKIGYKPLDVLIEKNGEWTANGKPTDAHEVFTRSHTVVDTTRMKGEKYQKLASEMGIPLIFSHADEMKLDREDMYRILRQKGFKVPKTSVIRASAPIKDSVFREIWSTYHTPLMVRPLEKINDSPSKLIKLFNDLEKIVREYHENGIDVHILTYKKAPTSSIGILPNFRGEKIYTPIWVETFASIGDIPNQDSPMRAHMNAPDFRKDQMKQFVTEVYEALNLSGPVCIDMIPYEYDYMVVNVDTTPSLSKDGRFMKSLATTGVDAGEYVHSLVQNDYILDK